MLSHSRSFAFYVFSFSSITSITNNLTDRQLDSDRRSDRSVIEVIEERFFNYKIAGIYYIYN